MQLMGPRQRSDIVTIAELPSQFCRRTSNRKACKFMIFSRTFMPDNAYHFVDRWRVEGDIKEVADILEDALSLPRWWSSVYFDVKEIEPGERHGFGKVISLYAGGWLFYTLCINFRIVVSNYLYGFMMDVFGDLGGKGIWTFAQEGRFVDVTYD